jgi:hypothetical protein
MPWWPRWLRWPKPEPQPTPESSTAVALPILVHTHIKGTVFPGTLEDGMVEIVQDDIILHGVAGIIQPDGTIGDLPEEELESARRLVYRHLKREGCLTEFGIPVIPEYERDA